MLTRFLITTALTLSLSSASHAQDATPEGVALFIANEDYSALWDARGADDVLDALPNFETARFRVDQATDVAAGAMRAALSELSQQLDAEPIPRLVMVFSGYVVNAGDDAWILGTEVSRPNLASVDANGVRLETLLALAGARQGTAVVAIADHGYRGTLGSGLSGGLPDDIAVPQGVSLLHGSVRDVTQALQSLAHPGENIVSIADGLAGVELEGFQPPFLSFVSGMADPGPSPAEREAAAELAAWNEAAEAGTLAAFSAYLEAWPNGAHAETARAEVERLSATPERIEAALGLSRDERRAIQRDLNLLGHNTRGIDGLFGPASRRAIAAWQTSNRFEGTSYLNRDQIFLLAQQGARRAAELEAEERRRREEQERRDRLYWRDTGSGNDEAGMRAYLERFPEGIFANIAHDRLRQIEQSRAREQDRADWREAQRRNSYESYQRYLEAHPRGEYARIARERMAEFEANWRAREARDWDAAVRADTIDAYRSYIDAYPRGRNVAAARQRIRELRNEARAERREREFWRQVRDANSVEAYNAYLNEYPRGAFADEARARIEALRGPVEPNPQPEPNPEPAFDEAAARRAERDLGLNSVTIGLIQTHLALSGFNPGRADGRLNARTREAIRAYQRQQGMPATGYLTGDLVAQMTLLGIFGRRD